MLDPDRDVHGDATVGELCAKLFERPEEVSRLLLEFWS